MSKKDFISDLKAGSIVESIFLVSEKEIRQKKGGVGDYLYMVLNDKTGKITAYMWENFKEIHQNVEPGSVIKVKANVKLHNNKLQLVLHNFEAIKEKIDLKDFLPASKENLNEIYKKIVEYIKTLKSTELQKLLLGIYTNDEIKPLLFQAPAAKVFHHACIGGLLEHTFSLIELSELILKHYKSLDRDLLIAGILLHDIGKIWEFNTQGFFEYTREGRLLGHIVMGIQLVERETNKIENFPKVLKENLIHLIISHHGEYEYGSPRRPKLKEALTLHFLDLIDSELKGFDEVLGNSSLDMAYSSQLDRYIFKT